MLNRWNGGEISIEISKFNYTTGDVVEGIVHVFLSEIFEGKELTVGLYGYEESYFRLVVSDSSV